MMNKKILDSKEYKEMIECLNDLVINRGYYNTLKYDIEKMISKPQTYKGWYDELKKDIKDFYGAIPKYEYNLLCYAKELFIVVEHQHKLDKAIQDWAKLLEKKYNVIVKFENAYCVAYERQKNKLGKEICREKSLCDLDITLKYYLS